MKRILFVDDDVHLLQGLQRMLRSMRQEWNMLFAASGAQALELLAKAPVDVIVTDMHMPEMDGAELLTRVRDLYPHVIRIVLSGQSSRDADWRSIRVAHRQLTKTCDADTLQANIQQACTLRSLLPNESALALVLQLESVSSLPASYQAIQQEL